MPRQQESNKREWHNRRKFEVISKLTTPLCRKTITCLKLYLSHSSKKPAALNSSSIMSSKSNPSCCSRETIIPISPMNLRKVKAPCYLSMFDKAPISLTEKFALIFPNFSRESKATPFMCMKSWAHFSARKTADIDWTVSVVDKKTTNHNSTRLPKKNSQKNKNFSTERAVIQDCSVKLDPRSENRQEKTQKYIFPPTPPHQG